MSDVSLSGVFFSQLGIQAGAFMDTRVAQRMTGRSQAGVGMTRRAGFMACQSSLSRSLYSPD